MVGNKLDTTDKTAGGAEWSNFPLCLECEVRSDRSVGDKHLPRGRAAWTSFRCPLLGLLEPGQSWPFPQDEIDSVGEEYSPSRLKKQGFSVLVPADFTPFGEEARSDKQISQEALPSLFPFGFLQEEGGFPEVVSQKPYHKKSSISKPEQISNLVIFSILFLMLQTKAL